MVDIETKFGKCRIEQINENRMGVYFLNVEKEGRGELCTYLENLGKYEKVIKGGFWNFPYCFA